MQAAPKQAIGQSVRLYAASGVESYIGTSTGVFDDHVTRRDDRHDEEMFIAIADVESLPVSAAQQRRRGRGKSS